MHQFVANCKLQVSFFMLNICSSKSNSRAIFLSWQNMSIIQFFQQLVSVGILKSRGDQYNSVTFLIDGIHQPCLVFLKPHAIKTFEFTYWPSLKIYFWQTTLLLQIQINIPSSEMKPLACIWQLVNHRDIVSQRQRSTCFNINTVDHKKQ